MTNVPELEDAVDRCKAMVIDQPDESEDKKLLVRRLIELRLRLHDLKEALKDGPNEQVGKIFSLLLAKLRYANEVYFL